MGMKNLCIIGHFCKNKFCFDGQTVKTRILTEELVRVLGKNHVKQIDTHNSKKHFFKLFLQIVYAFVKYKNIVILPAQNGVKVLVPLCCFLNKFFKRKIFYIVIGGWLPQYLRNKRKLLKQLKKFNGIFVETATIKKLLNCINLDNVCVMPNCKDLQILSENELVYRQVKPYKLCTFSRVMKEKGIEDIVNIVQSINQQKGEIVYELDIYGQVDPKQMEWFEQLRKKFPQYIRYVGVVLFDQSVNILKNYSVLVFPTHFYTEGIPGTIIDAYASGVPVITSRWESFEDVCREGETSISYTMGNNDELRDKLIQILKDKEQIFEMKKNCLEEAYKYKPVNVVKILLEQLSD